MAKKAKLKTYISRSSGTRELNQYFYSRYDPHFLFNRAITLYTITRERDKFTDALASFEMWEQIAPSIDEQYFGSLRAELRFLESHQFEAFFALLIGCISAEPTLGVSN